MSISMSFAMPYAALVTLGTVLLVFVFSARVGKYRAKEGVQPPVTTGSEEFNRAYRIHYNSIEQAVLFLPTLWVFAASVSDDYAGIAGLIWLVSRVMYSQAYMKEPKSRATGFMIGFLALLVMFGWSAFEVIAGLM